MDTAKITLAALAAWNVVVFVLYGADKWKAKREHRRIRERTLLLMALLMGAPGALAGMVWFHHKTRHTKFTISVPLLVILNLLVGGMIYCIVHL